jgi:putative transcriptional regulator
VSETRLSNNIRTLRFLAGEMTQAELGSKVGVTRQTIAAVEAGKYSPTLECAFRIAEALGKPLDEVFQWEQRGERPPLA